MSQNTDSLSRFVLESAEIRGEIVCLNNAWQELSARQDYGPNLRKLLGEAATATTLLAATIKFDGTLTLQTRADSALSLLVVEASAARTIRGLARLKPEHNEPNEPNDLLNEGHLAITVDQGEGKERYQGIVSLEGNRLSTIIENYFAQSEQLPTRIWLAVQENACAGLMLQQMPIGYAAREESWLDQETRSEAWNRCVILADSITDEELLSLPPERLLHRLFHQERVRLFSPERWSFMCRCSRDRVKALLKGLGQEEVESIVADEGHVNADCEFCGAEYNFDAVDVAELFMPSAANSPNWTM